MLIYTANIENPKSNDNKKNYILKFVGQKKSNMGYLRGNSANRFFQIVDSVLDGLTHELENCEENL